MDGQEVPEGQVELRFAQSLQHQPVRRLTLIILARYLTHGLTDHLIHLINHSPNHYLTKPY